jgi:hypothetical protein
MDEEEEPIGIRRPKLRLDDEDHAAGWSAWAAATMRRQT